MREGLDQVVDEHAGSAVEVAAVGIDRVDRLHAAAVAGHIIDPREILA